MSDRGEYRSIHTVLVDGPDFQQLEPDERLTFLVAKLSCGASGIDVIPALVPTLIERTGMDEARVTRALDVLEATGWIRRERNVLWIVDGLRYEPSLSPENPRHRTGVQRHAKGLPRLAIVKAFIEHYRDWFDNPDTLSNGYPEATESQSGATRITEDGRRKTEEGTKGARPARPDKAAPWMSVIRPIYVERYDGDPPAHLVKALRPAIGKHGEAEVARRFRIYCARTEGRFFDAFRFVATWGEWASEAPPASAHDPASAFYAILRDHGLLHQSRDEFRATVDRLVAEGVIPDREEFIARCRRIEFPTLRAASADRFAVAHIRDRCFTPQEVA